MARPSKVSHIAHIIVHGVASGRWAEGSTLAPTRELAQRMKVAQKTLLRALAEVADLGIIDLRLRQRGVVPEEGRKRAQAVLRQQGESSRLERLTLLMAEDYVHWTEPGYYWNIIARELKTEAALQGLETSLLPLPRQGQVEFVRSLSGQVRNVSVALGVNYDHLPAIQEASLCGLPVILHNRWVPLLHVPAVQRDDYAAARRIGEMLRNLGHRNMCMLSVNLPNPLFGHDRYEGWLTFLRESGLIKECTPPLFASPHFEEIRLYIQRLLHGPDAPTAIVFAMPMVGGFFKVFDPSFCGPMDIPRQLSVVTWDETVQVGLPGAEVTCTNVRVDHRRMSQCIIEMARKIQDGDLCPPSVRVRCDIEVTDSIGPPRPPG